MQVEVFVDPACGWSQVTVGWLQEVASADPTVEVQLAPFSLLLRDGVEGRPAAQLARRTASRRAVRVLARLGEAGDRAAAIAFWEAVVAQDGPVPFTDLPGAIAASGADPTAAAAADDETVDETIRRSMAQATELAGGGAVALPALVLDGTVHFTGPLLRNAPRGDRALALFDAVVELARTPGFYELSRPRPSHPELPGLPPPPVPPQL